jgi:hypothetical protein
MRTNGARRKEGKTNEFDRGRRARTAEANAAGTAVVVDAEKVRAVRPATPAHEIDHVDPTGHLGGASSCPLLVRRIHTSWPPSSIYLLSIAVYDDGDNEEDNPREQEATRLESTSCGSRSI